MKSSTLSSFFKIYFAERELLAELYAEATMWQIERLFLPSVL